MTRLLSVRRTFTVVLLLAGLFVAVPATARGATVVGAKTGGTQNFGLNCGNPPGQPCALTATIQAVDASHQAPGGATVPAAGVITGWSLSHAGIKTISWSAAVASSLTVNLRVIRGAGATGIGAGTGPTETLSQTPGTYSFPARLSVRAGDRVGFDLRFAPGDLLLLSGVKGGSGSSTGVVAGGIWPDGGSPASYQSFDGGPPSFATVYLPMNVTVEPDVDGDGYGDETQDGCPSSPASHGACPPPPDTSAPETTITKQPKKKSARKKATFDFESSEGGSTFECALNDKGVDELLKQFNECSSPRVYKGLKRGKFTFEVRARDAAGNADPTPATATFKVVKKGKKGRKGR